MARRGASIGGLGVHPGRSDVEEHRGRLLPAARDGFGLSQIVCWFDQGSTLPRAEVERAMRRFVEQVMPKLASR